MKVSEIEKQLKDIETNLVDYSALDMVAAYDIATTDDAFDIDGIFDMVNTLHSLNDQLHAIHSERRDMSTVNRLSPLFVLIRKLAERAELNMSATYVPTAEDTATAERASLDALVDDHYNQY